MMQLYRILPRWLKQASFLVWGALIGTAAILAGCCAHYIDRHTED